MRKFEFVFDSVNSLNYSKPIRALALLPQQIDSNCGFMLFTHGWGGNRFGHLEIMKKVAEEQRLICLSCEYRMSGYDFNEVSGSGSYIPYDASFLQVFDVLNMLREALLLFPQANQRRIFHYGGSQGGHIALLSAIFAPQTFNAIYSSSAITWLSPKKVSWTGRIFTEYELSARNVIEHAQSILCPLFLEHGTEDETVGHEGHAIPLVEKLQSLGKPHYIKYYEGGSHSLLPTISKAEAFAAMFPRLLALPQNSKPNDFENGSLVSIPCGQKTLQINWAEPSSSNELFQWL